MENPYSDEGGLKVTPRWTGPAYFGLVAALFAFAAYGLAWHGRDDLEGTAVVLVDDAVAVTAPTSGAVASIDVDAGEHVAAGQVLVHVQAIEDQAELDRIRDGLERHVIELLKSLHQEAARQSVANSRTEEERAFGRTKMTEVRAPCSGTISDIRIRSGERFDPDTVLLSIVQADKQPTVLLILPAQARPLLRAGEPFLLELDGYPFARQQGAIETVADDVIRPAELRRFLGAKLADSVNVHDPVMLAFARVASDSFIANGRSYRVHDGMHGRVHVRIGSRTLLPAHDRSE